MQQPKKIAIGLLLGFCALAVLIWLADYFINREDVPRGASIGGVVIGGLTPAAAVERLENNIVMAPVRVRAGDMTSTFDPADSGLRPDWEATVAALGHQSLNPWTRLRGLVRTFEVDIVSQTDSAFAPAVARVHHDLTVAPTNAALWLAAGQVHTTEAAPGQEVDLAHLAKAMSTQWLHEDGVVLDVEVTQPAISSAALSDATAEATRALAGPVVAHGRGADGVIPPERMGEVLTFVPEGEKLRPEINLAAAQEIFAATLAGTELPARNAQISFAAGKEITPSVDGYHVDWDASLVNLKERVLGAHREFEVVYAADPARFRTEQAEAATFSETVGEFSTGGFSGPSGINIGLVAATVDGAIVAPGDTFSLNGYTGPRGIAQGYVESGIILNGHSDTAVGGGISQFATTLYNAAYFAGMTDVTHTAHSYYISRYPAGREATVYEGLIDLQFRNDSPYPVLIDTNFDGGQITVSLRGVKTVTVESVNGGQWNPTQPQTMTLTGATCAPAGGAPGFTTSDTRIIRDLSGTELSRETTTTVYDPQPIVTCA